MWCAHFKGATRQLHDVVFFEGGGSFPCPIIQCHPSQALSDDDDDDDDDICVSLRAGDV